MSVVVHASTTRQALVSFAAALLVVITRVRMRHSSAQYVTSALSQRVIVLL